MRIVSMSLTIITYYLIKFLLSKLSMCNNYFKEFILIYVFEIIRYFSK